MFWGKGATSPADQSVAREKLKVNFKNRPPEWPGVTDVGGKVTDLLQIFALISNAGNPHEHLLFAMLLLMLLMLLIIYYKKKNKNKKIYKKYIL